MSKHKSPLAHAVGEPCAALSATFIPEPLVNAVILVSPIYSMQVYDRVLNSRNLMTVAMLSAIALVIMLLYGVLEYARSACWSAPGVMFETRLAGRCSGDDAAEMDRSSAHRASALSAMRNDPRILARPRTGSAICRGRRCSSPCVSSCTPVRRRRAAGALILFSLGAADRAHHPGREWRRRAALERGYGFAASALRNGQWFAGSAWGTRCWSAVRPAAAAVASNAAPMSAPRCWSQAFAICPL